MAWSWCLFLITISATLRTAYQDGSCPVGEFLETESCVPCDKGSYKDKVGPGPCEDCPVDEDGVSSTTLRDGANSEEDCFYRPYISDYSPTKGPKAGGSEINITIQYLEGKSVSYVKIMEIKAEIIERDTSSLLVKTGSSDEEGLGRIRIFLTDQITEYTIFSETEFNYTVNPEIFDIKNPSTILSGGTTLTVIGSSLDVVSKPLMIITRYQVSKNITDKLESLCDVKSSEEMTCVVPDLMAGLYEEETEAPIEVTTAAEKMTTVTTVKSDKLTTETVVYTTQPLTTTTQPSNFNLLCNRTETETINNGTHIITVTRTTTCENGRNRRKRDADEPSSNPDLRFYVGFELDGVDSYNNFGNLTVYDNPDYFTFESENKIQPHNSKENKFLNIYGERLNLGISKDDIGVFVGIEVCEVTALSTNVLTCVPPFYKPDPGPDGEGPKGSVRVIVHAGNFDFVVGYLYYLDSESANTFILIIALFLVFSLWVLTLIIVLILFCPKRRKKEKINTGNSSDPLYSTDTSEGSGSNGASSLDTQMTLVPWDIVLDTLDEDLKEKVSECQLEGDTLVLGEMIGVGSFGRVFKGTLENDGQNLTVAVKMLKGVRHNYESEVAQFLEEALVMKGFNHDHILGLHGVVIMEYIPYVVLEYMAKGDLKTYVSKLKEGEVLESELVGLGLQVAKGMVYLCANGFIHRDLAARNCLVNDDVIVKIGDFGLSRDLHGTDYYRVLDRGRPLPVKWMSPESLNLGKFTSKSDVWSFGVLLWELLTRGRMPYSHVNNMDLKDYINQGHRLDKPSNTSQYIYALMSLCWSESPDDRPTFEAVCESMTELLENKSLNDET